jgi:hypothetical protein
VRINFVSSVVANEETYFFLEVDAEMARGSMIHRAYFIECFHLEAVD